MKHIFAAVLIIMLVCEARRHHSSSSLPLSRIRLETEFREIEAQGLLLTRPFNMTDPEEVGIRLVPTKNILEWHFSFTGPTGSAYEHGVYHGRIRLPSEYPRKAPSISMLTPNGRWEINKDICFSGATAYHPENWDMSWNLRTITLALKSHMLTKAQEVGGVSSTKERKERLALESRLFVCPHPHCRASHTDLLDPFFKRDQPPLPPPLSGGGGRETGRGHNSNIKTKTKTKVRSYLKKEREKEKGKHITKARTRAGAGRGLWTGLSGAVSAVVIVIMRLRVTRQAVVVVGAIVFNHLLRIMGVRSVFSFSIGV